MVTGTPVTVIAERIKYQRERVNGVGAGGRKINGKRRNRYDGGEDEPNEKAVPHIASWISRAFPALLQKLCVIISSTLR